MCFFDVGFFFDGALMGVSNGLYDAVMIKSSFLTFQLQFTTRLDESSIYKENVELLQSL